MKYIINMARQSYLSITFAIAIVVLFSAAGVWGASTISTNISTGGTLSVTGTSTLTGAVAASSTLQVTGAVTNYGALTQTGAASFTGAIWASSTAQFTGAVTNYSTLLQTSHLWASSTLAVTGVSTFQGDVTMNGASGALVLTTTNAATSSATIGCINTYATSTETPVRIHLGAASTSAGTTFGAAGTGFVVWTYGACS